MKNHDPISKMSAPGQYKNLNRIPVDKNNIVIKNDMCVIT